MTLENKKLIAPALLFAISLAIAGLARPVQLQAGYDSYQGSYQNDDSPDYYSGSGSDGGYGGWSSFGQPENWPQTECCAYNIPDLNPDDHDDTRQPGVDYNPPD